MATKAKRTAGRGRSLKLQPVDHPAVRRPTPAAAAAIAEYPRLVAQAKLENVALVRVAAELHAARLPDLDDGDVTLQLITPSPEYRSSFIAKTRVLQAGARLRVSVAKAENAPPVLEITAEYVLSYTVPEDVPVSTRLAQMFAQQIGVFNAWPFFRELAHSMATRMSMPPLVVPLLRLPPVPPR